MTAAPTLQTERLTLRAQKLEDFEPFAAMFATDRTIHMGGPLSRRDAWLWFAADSGCWQLLNLGAWTIERKTDSAVLGQTGINQPEFFPEIELGWMLYDGFEGHGYATEAASAARNWAFGPRGLKTLVSYVSPGNSASIAVATRLGARADDTAKRPDPEDLVFRHPAAVTSG